MRTAMTDKGRKTHYVTDMVAEKFRKSKGRIMSRVLCGGYIVEIGDEDGGLIPYSDSFCKRCESIRKIREEGGRP
jgi:hypothetical protein